MKKQEIKNIIQSDSDRWVTRLAMEIERCTELIKVSDTDKANAINSSIKRGEEALRKGNTLEIITAREILKLFK